MILMSLAKRRLLYTAFILLFFIITPVIFFYAAGYNFNLNSGSIERTGILMIKTEPRNAQVSLGERKKHNWLYDIIYGDKILTTPLKLRNLLPGDYEVTISKEGYFDYRKQINLLSGRTIVLDNILLVKNSEPVVVVDEDIIKTELSPDKNKLAVITNNFLAIINLNNGRASKIPLDFQFSFVNDFEIKWSNDGKKILLAIEKFPIYNTETLTKDDDLADYVQTYSDVLRWDNSDSNKIFSLKNNILWQIDLANESASIISLPLKKDTVIKDFIVKDNYFYFLENSEDGSYLVSYEKDNRDIVKSIMMPNSKNYEFSEIYSSSIYARDQKQKSVYVMNPMSLVPIYDVINNVEKFSEKNGYILYWNDFEIWLYNINAKSKNILTRISEKIDKAVLDENYVIYNTENGIKTIERAENIYFNMTDILDWQETENLIINPNNDLVYFIGWLDGKRVLYSLRIK